DLRCSALAAGPHLHAGGSRARHRSAGSGDHREARRYSPGDLPRASRVPVLRGRLPTWRYRNAGYLRAGKGHPVGRVQHRPAALGFKPPRHPKAPVGCIDRGFRPTRHGVSSFMRAPTSRAASPPSTERESPPGLESWNLDGDRIEGFEDFVAREAAAAVAHEISPLAFRHAGAELRKV